MSLEDYVEPAEKLKLPDQLIEELLAAINSTFYKAATAKRWMQDQKPLMLALTWPASWMAERGISMTVERYEKILRGVLEGIRRHGETAKIEHFPSYLLRCVRLHFVHHGEDLWQEQKRLTASLDLRFLDRGPAKAAATPDPIAALSAAHRVLASGSKRAKAAKTDAFQASLFDA